MKGNEGANSELPCRDKALLLIRLFVVELRAVSLKVIESDLRAHAGRPDRSTKDRMDTTVSRGKGEERRVKQGRRETYLK